MNRKLFIITATTVTAALLALLAFASVTDDPLVRMPGTQPGEGVSLESPDRCFNCHGNYNPSVEPGHNWKGSMMAQAARDPLFWACMTVAAQDAMWAVGDANATDLCLRCHFPKGWLEGRSDPTNAALMTGSDFDGVQCDFCHTMYDPFFEATYSGAREGSDWAGYWDETNNSSTPSQAGADEAYGQDLAQAQTLRYFNGSPFYPLPGNYTENASGQYFVSTGSQKRSSFADAAARHQMLYSRYHKSKFFCATCHDVSNPVLANLSANPAIGLPTEVNSAFSYYHVERTFSEFMLSDYGQDGGAFGIGPFAPGVFETSLPGNRIGKCQDCHMRDVAGLGCNKKGAPYRPDQSVEHPKSGVPLHDLTGGNVWISAILASAVVGSPNYDATNASLLNQGPSVLTLDLAAGMGVDPSAMLAGSERARQQLELAASINNLSFDPATGSISFQVQNQTGHKLISGFPEGRRMFVNIRGYAGGDLVYEVNPYDAAAGTLKGLHYNYQAGFGLPSPAAPGPSESYQDALVYETHPSSGLTGESESFHFVLADERFKDNRIPPKGFRVAEAAARLSVSRHEGAPAPDLYTAAEYAGGYDQVSMTLPGLAGSDRVEVNLYYQTTSREYIEFLRDEINANPNNRTLPDGAYVIAGDPFFNQLRAWGDTIWQLWSHNKDLPGASPVLMTMASWGDAPPPPPCATPGVPQNLTANGGKRSVTINWSPGAPAPEGGYRVYYDQAGKTQYLDSVGPGTTTYKDNRLTRGSQYCYVVTAWQDCNGNGSWDSGEDLESGLSNVACATPQ